VPDFGDWRVGLEGGAEILAGSGGRGLRELRWLRWLLRAMRRWEVAIVAAVWPLEVGSAALHGSRWSRYWLVEFAAKHREP